MEGCIFQWSENQATAIQIGDIIERVVTTPAGFVQTELYKVLSKPKMFDDMWSLEVSDVKRPTLKMNVTLNWFDPSSHRKPELKRSRINGLVRSVYK